MKLNSAPYFNDYSPDKGFLKVLFNPARNIQPKELTQIQSIIEHQRNSFASHIFKNNSQVQGPCIKKVKSVAVSLTTEDGGSNSLGNMLFVGVSSGAKAKCVFSSKTKAYISYQTASLFTASEYIDVYSLSLNGTVEGERVIRVKLTSSNYTGFGEIWMIPDSVFFINGNFITLTPSIIACPEGESSYLVGLDVVDRIINSDIDPSLLDNSIESVSYLAPGADRKQTLLLPSIRPLEYSSENNFVTLAVVKNGEVTFSVTQPEYGTLYSTLAERTFDESGNYTVVPFRISIREHLKSNDTPDGAFTAEEGGDSSLFIIDISAGKAYVKGYEINKTVSTKITTNKISIVSNQHQTRGAFSDLSSVKIIPSNGSSIYQRLNRENLFTNKKIIIYSGPLVNKRASGVALGEFYGIDVSLSSSDSTAIGAVYNLYFVGLKLYSGKNFADAKSIEFVEDPVIFSASLWVDSSSTTPRINNPNSPGLMWSVATDRSFSPDVANAITYGSLRKCSTLFLDGYGSGTITQVFDSGEGFDDFDFKTTLGGIVSGTVFTPVSLENKFTVSSDRKSIHVSIGPSYSGKQLVIFYSVTQKLQRKTKSIRQKTETISLSDNALKLSCYDLFQVLSITKGGVEVKNHFTYVPSEYSYGTCKLTSDGTQSDGSYTIVYKHCIHSTGHYFDINSYSSFVTDIVDLPRYQGKSIGDYIDFRPLIQTTNEIANISLPLSNGIFTTITGQVLPRIDTIALGVDGSIRLIPGIPSTTPVPPNINPQGTQFPLFQLFHKNNGKTVDENITIKPLKTQRYTMRDIGKLEKRISAAEYLTSFTLEESFLAFSQVFSTNGSIKYKNGIILDNFSSKDIGALADSEFRASYDHDKRVLRPSFERFNVQFELDKTKCSQLSKFIDEAVMIDYNEEVFINQQFASRSVSVTPYLDAPRQGVIVLTPPFDNNIDVNTRSTNTFGTWNVRSSVVSNIRTATYIRNSVVQFSASGLKPNTTIYAFFDGKPVSEFCRPLDPFMSYGSPLSSDANGNCVGQFQIPAETFFTGEKIFRLSSDLNNIMDEEALSTFAEQKYLAQGISYDVQEINTIVAPPQATNSTQSRDPIAQSFTVVDSCFVTAVDLFFYTKAVQDTVFVRIVEMDNGYPTKTIIAEKLVRTSAINLSTGSEVATKITFDFPVYLEGGGREYALVVGANDSATRVWVSKLGENDIATNSLISTQPNMGSFFKSQNSSTWDASQEEDLKFKLYRARFKSNTMVVALKSKPFVDELITTNPIETQTGKREVRIHCKGHALSVGDTIHPQFLSLDTINVTLLDSRPLLTGQVLRTDTGSGTVVKAITNSNGTVDVKLRNITGYFTTGQVFRTNTITLIPQNRTQTERLIGATIDQTTTNTAIGKINVDFHQFLNGIPIEELNQDLIVRAVDSMNSVIVQVLTPATSTGFVGGDVILDGNKMYDAFSVYGAWSKNGANSLWNFYGIGSSILEEYYADNYIRQPAIPINVFDEDISLLKPFKIANSFNETRNLQNSNNVMLVGTFTSASPLLSPIVRADTFSMVGVHNLIDVVDETRYNVLPNATDRLVPETHPTSGVLSYKYVTNEIVLENSALDMKIMLRVHKPQDSDFDIYVKTKSPWNQTQVSELPWVKIEGINKNFVCTEEDEFVDVSFILSELMPTVFGREEYNFLKLKITGTGINTSQPVLFKMLQIIALT